MTFWAAMAGGFVGTLVLTTALRLSSELRVTRTDLPFLLGTMFLHDRQRAKALGYFLHFFFGFAFALGYLAIFSATGRSGWIFGAVLGLIHGAFAGTALVNILLPIVHPRMGDPMSGANSVALLEPPGFMLRNYGRGTAIVLLLAHVVYGSIVGGFVAWAQ